MQFFYNSGMPQRQRRTRDSRTNAVNRDVPSLLVYPDGSHSLGFISGNSAAAATGGGQADDDGAGFDSAVAGAFVVWADPMPSSRRTWWGSPASIFYAILGVDAILSVFIIADSIRSGPMGEKRISAPPSELPPISFAIGSLSKLVGLWGVYTDSMRYLTLFIAVCLLHSILSLMWLSKVSHLTLALLDLALVISASHIRGRLMGQWFSARTNGPNR